MTLIAKHSAPPPRRRHNAAQPWCTIELKPQVEDWLEWLTAQEFATVAHYMDVLARQGPLLGEPYTRRLEREIRELRFYLDGQAIRLTYWFASGRRIILLAVSHRKHERARHAWARYVTDEEAVAETVAEEDVIVLAERNSWKALRKRRMAEPGAAEAYETTRRAYELGAAVRTLRKQRGWSQEQLGRAAGLTQAAVGRFELGGANPTLPVLEQLAQALDAELVVQLSARNAA